MLDSQTAWAMRAAFGRAGRPVSLDYYDKVPFKFNGTIEQVHVEYMVTKK
jgi:hypothetical protein